MPRGAIRTLSPPVMKTTTALSARMRQFLANLHPPSPPTAKEGQQLLNVLQSSFKRRLDAKHPNPFQNTPHDNAIPTSRDHASSQAASSYFGSVLTHPILGAAPHVITHRDAVARFDRFVAEARVDIQGIPGLIRRHIQELNEGSSQIKAQPGERFGDKLNAWLMSTGPATKEDFFLAPPIRKAAFDLLALEGNEATLWKWLRMVYERRLINAHITSVPWLSVEDRLVSELMHISIRRGHTNDAAQQFVQAVQYRSQSGRGPSAMHAGKRLAATIIYKRYDHGITPELFTGALEHLPAWTSAPDLSSALCAIYAPLLPTPQRLLTHLHNPAEAKLLTDSQAVKSSLGRRVVLTAILDASKLALDQGSKRDATFFLDYAITNYSDILPARKVEETEPQLEIFSHQLALG